MRSWRGWSWDDGNFGGSGLEPQKGRYRWQKLSAAAQQQGVTVGNGHRALGDCLMTLGVVRAMASTENAKRV